MNQQTNALYQQQIMDYVKGMVLPDKITVLYCRLSKDDPKKKKEDESNSIVNQKKMLAKHARDHNLINPFFFVDDGISGTTFNRESVQSALELAEARRVVNFVVKDLSRFGRNNSLVGYYTEHIFPQLDIRFIAIGDDVDDTTGESDIKTQFQNMYNEHHPRETSRKVREYFEYKGGKDGGLPLSSTPPYGYKKNSETKLWVVDEEAAEVVRQIFQWCIEGLGITQIANLLREKQVYIPRVHAANEGIRKCNRNFDPYDWGFSTISSILSRREYLGHIVNFKTYRKSFKHKKTLFNSPDKYVVLENKHPAIISQDVFDTVQQLRSTKRRRSFSGRVNLFQGLCCCNDCKSNMNLACGSCLKPTQDYYSCSGFANKKKKCESSHYIRRVVLEQAVLTYLQKVTAFAEEHEDVLVQRLQSRDTTRVQKISANDKKSLLHAEKRIVELDGIIAKLFEKNATGILSDERFVKLSQDYETEQAELKVKSQALKTQLETQQEAHLKTDNFLALVRKYTRITELSTVMINELVERIEVHAPNKSTGKRTQQVDIYFNFVGNIGSIWESNPQTLLYAPLKPIPVE